MLNSQRKCLIAQVHATSRRASRMATLAAHLEVVNQAAMRLSSRTQNMRQCLPRHLPLGSKMGHQPRTAARAVKDSVRQSSSAAVDTFDESIFGDDGSWEEVPVHTVIVHDRRDGSTYEVEVPQVRAGLGRGMTLQRHPRRRSTAFSSILQDLALTSES